MELIRIGEIFTFLEEVEVYCSESEKTVLFNRTIDELLVFAESGNPIAQYIIAKAKHFGEGVERNKHEAYEWYKKSASKKFPPAVNNLGVCYQEGIGVEKNLTLAVKFYQEATDLGGVKGAYNLGISYMLGEGVEKNIEKALNFYKKSAQDGFMKAQYQLGNYYSRYDENLSVQERNEQAIFWYTKAAKQGHLGSMNELGNAYYLGECAEQDYQNAFFWFEKAAKLGDAYAQNVLGAMYRDGEGVGKDYTCAFEWFQKSARQGYSTAEWNLAHFYHSGLDGKRDYKNATNWYKKAIKSGSCEAKTELRKIYISNVSFGVGVFLVVISIIIFLLNNLFGNNNYAVYSQMRDAFQTFETLETKSIHVSTVLGDIETETDLVVLVTDDDVQMRVVTTITFEGWEGLFGEIETTLTGYYQDGYLFTGIGSDVDWRFVNLGELSKIKVDIYDALAHMFYHVHTLDFLTYDMIKQTSVRQIDDDYQLTFNLNKYGIEGFLNTGAIGISVEEISVFSPNFRIRIQIDDVGRIVLKDFDLEFVSTPNGFNHSNRLRFSSVINVDYGDVEIIFPSME